MTDRFPKLEKPRQTASTVCYEGRFLRVEETQITLPSGHESALTILHHPGAAAVVPLHEDGTVTLVYQYRHAVGKFIYEIPAGLLEPEEDPEACAGRELIEEVGLQAGQIERLIAFDNSAGSSDQTTHVYVGRELVSVPQQLEDDEYLQVVRMPLTEALEMVRAGKIADAKTVIGLLLVTAGGTA